MSKELYSAGGDPKFEYCSAILAMIQRYLRDGHPLSLTTAIANDGTAITFHFDRTTLSPYLAKVDSSLGETTAYLERAHAAVAPDRGEAPALR